MTHLPDTFSGSMALQYWLPDGWPPSELAIMMNHKLVDGHLLISVTSRGTLIFALWRSEAGAEHCISAVETPPIFVTDSHELKMLWAWSEGEINCIYLGDSCAYNRADPGERVSSIWLGVTRVDGQHADYSAKNEQARRNRYSTFRGRHASKGRIPGDDRYLVDALRDELEQIKDLSDLIERGKESHVPGLAARIRLLVIDKPLGLLQHCAAIKQANLTLYTEPFPEWRPGIEGSYFLIGSPSGAPDRHHRNPVDLDVWLGFVGVGLQGKTFTNRQLIKEIGDTIGAHRDPDIGKLVDILQAGRAGPSERYRDVQTYLVRFAGVLLILSEPLFIEM